MEGYRTRPVEIWPDPRQSLAMARYMDPDQACLDLIRETPLAIRVQGRPYTVVMRTPGDELAHAAGLCLAEGIADAPGDLAALGYCDETINVVTVTLTPERARQIPDILERKAFISQTSCGICGKTLIRDLRQSTCPVPRATALDAGVAVRCLNRLSRFQTRRRCSHTTVIFSGDGTMLSVGEDVGRHNALDKSVGHLFMDGRLDRAALAVVSSRVSYELVQKAARAGIGVIFSVSGPTALAVDLADSLDMAIVSQNKTGELFVFCGAHRLDRPGTLGPQYNKAVCGVG